MTDHYELAQEEAAGYNSENTGLIYGLLAIADAIRESSAPVEIDMSNFLDTFGLQVEEGEE